MIEKTHKWLRVLAFMPILAGIVLTNVYVDPASIFHDIAQSVTNEIMAGNDVFFTMGNGNERANKKCLIQNLPKYVECITVGPSLSMGIRADHVGTSNYYNLSASGYNYYDYMAVFGLLNYSGIKFDKLVLCIDSYFFDENIVAGETRYAIWKDYAYYMEDLLNNIERVRKPTSDLKIYAFYTNLTQMFSPSYFRESLKCLAKYHKELFLEGKRWGVVNDEATASFAHYKSDGSWVYALSFVNNTVDFVINESRTYNIERQFGKGLHPSEYRKKMFVKMLEYLIANNVKIEFFLCPPAPALWDRVTKGKDAQEYFMFSELEQFANEIAKKYNIQVIGTYNPHKINIPNEDYLDARHIRHEKLAHYFSFNSF